MSDQNRYPDPLPDLTGRTAVVTGAGRGLGYETARALGLAGASVIATARRPAQADDLAQRLRSELGGRSIRGLVLDVANPASIAEFSDVIGADGSPLDLLVHNAGIMATPPADNDQGIEMQMATNHIGPVLLTSLLWPALTAAPAARVVTVTSDEYAKITLDKVDQSTLRQPSPSMTPWSWYGLTKLASLGFSVEMAERLARSGSPIVSVAAHPGLASTGLSLGVDGGLRRLGTRIGMAVIGQKPIGGSRSIVAAAVGTNTSGGQLWAPNGFGGLRGTPAPQALKGPVTDSTIRRQIWEASLELAGATFPGL